MNPYDAKFKAFLQNGRTAPSFRFEALRDEHHGGAVRICITNVADGRIAKRFAPSTTSLEARRWLSARHPGGAWVETERFGRMWMYGNSLGREADIPVSAKHIGMGRGRENAHGHT